MKQDCKCKYEQLSSMDIIKKLNENEKTQACYIDKRDTYLNITAAY